MLNFVKDFIVGGISGALAKTIIAPIERVKLLLQLQSASKQISTTTEYKGMIDCFLRIPREQGFLSYWRGNLTNVIKYFPIQSLNFSFKMYYKKLLMKNTDIENEFWGQMVNNLVCGGAAGVTSTSIVYPLDFARTHLSVDIGKNIEERRHKGLIDIIIKTNKLDGPFGMYRGFLMCAQGVFIYRAVYFGFFDTATEMLCDRKTTPYYVYLILAHAITTFSGFLAYPFDTVGRRMMLQSRISKDEKLYKSSFDCIRKMVREEGVTSFFKGGLTNVVRSLGGALVLVFFQEFRSYI